LKDLPAGISLALRMPTLRPMQSNARAKTNRLDNALISMMFF